MKMTYFKYFVDFENTKYHFDLPDLLQRFVKNHNTEYEKTFQFREDSVYLRKVQKNLYLFLSTNDTEIIKAINKVDPVYEDIRKKLGSDEVLGFASYIYIDKYFYGMGSTMHGPKESAFKSFISQIFKNSGYESLNFRSILLTTNISKGDVSNFEFIGSTTFEVDPKAGIVNQFATLFGEDVSNIKSYRITIKPNRSSNLKKAIKKLAENSSEAEIEKWTIKAKYSLDENLQDYYVSNNGAVSDIITDLDEKKILQIISEKISSNYTLNEKIDEHKTNKIYREKLPISSDDLLKSNDLFGD
jgi:hypothetical protein